jgi:hypothetical protein
VGAIVVVACCLCVFVWVPANWEQGLARAESAWDLPVSEVGPWFSGWTFGDGQAFAVVATDPLGDDAGATLGDPAYRYMRAGFGWLTWMVSLGRPGMVPYAMTAIGLASIGLLYLLAVRRRGHLGPSAWLLCLNPAVFVALARGTAESLGVLLLTLAWLTGRWAWAAALGVVRPSFLVALVGKRRLVGSGLIVGVCIALSAAWRFGFDLSQYGGRLTLPVVGYVKAADALSWLVALAALATVLLGIRERRWDWMVAGTFVLCLAPAVVEHSINSIRAAGMLPVLWAIGTVDPSATRGDSEPEVVLDLRPDSLTLSGAPGPGVSRGAPQKVETAPIVLR